ncbi:ferrous iron transport protein B [Thermoactinomyces mirandus]|uniref:Ferrous iron transport protein B n=1 Tax=Thermoactinomyces mirandus TaxID=2756294 RepID=A0A7W1XSE7_9BACL|nr:ferrous iron transport protein B [Thermoactinomyces mirandus]MBA4602379.1 ferrous iron transport protein B [Thermoactinomyces mirandus]
MMNVALIGNPNTGKTSLFNALTGFYEYVGNWSGVTVEKKVGKLKDELGQLIDLPGIYSLNPLSEDEAVVSNFLLTEDFSAVLNIVDASQLERNLYLTLQVLEYGKPVVIALNMFDVAKGRGLKIDTEKLSLYMKTPVIPVVARKGTGIDQVKHYLREINAENQEALVIHYGEILENAIQKLIRQLPDSRLPKRWLALQFFEGNKPVWELLKKHVDESVLQKIFAETEKRIAETESVSSLDRYIRQIRRQWICNVLEKAISHSPDRKVPLSDRIDRIVVHKVWGMPIFMLLMYLVFKFTFDWLGSPLSDALDAFITGPVTNGISSGLEAIGASSFVKAVILDGIVAGVGGVLVFVPQIMILFFFISLLEDSGYMARVAMVMDRLMEIFGLNGKAFIPMIIGFGCNVPGVMAARTIEQPSERLLTIVLTPMMSCSARLPVYTLFAGAFFAENQALVVFSLYFLGIVVALVMAKILTSTLLKHKESVFVVELPPYRVPQGQVLFRSTWEKGKGFLRKAGTFILGGSVLIWFLSYAGPGGLSVDMNESYLAMIGGFLGTLLAPIGFGTWQAGAALITGFLAKEVVVSTMNILYASPDISSLQGIIAGSFIPLEAFSFIVFILLYIPCLATVAVIRKETNSLRWTLFSMGYSLAIAYVISLIIYQGGKLLGLG